MSDDKPLTVLYGGFLRDLVQVLHDGRFNMRSEAPETNKPALYWAQILQLRSENHYQLDGHDCCGLFSDMDLHSDVKIDVTMESLQRFRSWGPTFNRDQHTDAIKSVALGLREEIAHEDGHTEPVYFDVQMCNNMRGLDFTCNMLVTDGRRVFSKTEYNGGLSVDVPLGLIYESCVRRVLMPIMSPHNGTFNWSIVYVPSDSKTKEALPKKLRPSATKLLLKGYTTDIEWASNLDGLLGGSTFQFMSATHLFKSALRTMRCAPRGPLIATR
jgi:hypothetical protein